MVEISAFSGFLINLNTFVNYRYYFGMENDFLKKNNLKKNALHQFATELALAKRLVENGGKTSENSEKRCL